jgi:hypothetical protein
MTFILFCDKDHEEIEDGIKPEGRSFVCKNLATVKIKCHEEDERVHVLAQFFVANGISMEKISVDRRPTRVTRQTCESFILTVSCKSLTLLLFLLNDTKATKCCYIFKVITLLLFLLQ